MSMNLSEEMPFAFTESEKDELMKDEMTFLSNNLDNVEALQKFKLQLEVQKLIYEMRSVRPRCRPR